MNMDMRTVYPSRWWMADDFDNIGKAFKIGNVMMQQVGSGFRPCMFFHGVEKGLVVWEAVSKQLIDVLGTAESNSWVGREIVLFSFDATDQKGKAVKRLGIRLPDDGALPAPPMPPISIPNYQKPLKEEMNDDLPF